MGGYTGGGAGLLEITDGGTVNSYQGYVGAFPGDGVVGQVFVNGVGSIWTVTEEFVVGDDTTTGYVSILNGARISSKTGLLGGSGGTGLLYVVGDGSTWENSRSLYVGADGVGGVIVQEGGRVASSKAYIGDGVNGEGNLTVVGEKSLFESKGVLAVGYQGLGNFQVSEGAKATSAEGIIGGDQTSAGSVLIEGEGSRWENAANLIVGDQGKGGLDILDGGYVSNTYGTLGAEKGSIGNVTVSGANSQWISSNNLTVGKSGSGFLSVDDGGYVKSSQPIIVAEATGSEGSLTVSGVGSMLESKSLLNVGQFGVGDFRVLDGGKAVSELSFIGADPGGEGTVTVAGDNSVWINNNELYVGFAGKANLAIEGGALVKTKEIRIAQESTSTGILDLYGDATSRGVLETAQVKKGLGNASLNLNGGVFRATADTDDYLEGFTQVELSAGGVVFDTNGHTVGLKTLFSSEAGDESGVIKQGAGTLYWETPGHSHTGTTEVHEGTLRLGEHHVLSAASAHYVKAGATLDLAGYKQSMKSLSNSGTVVLSTVATQPSLVASPPPSTLLKITDGYTSQNGMLLVATVLESDGSASDKILLSGSNAVATGDTTVVVTSAGGLGARTTGRGIEIITTEGGASLGEKTFTLMGEHVDAGAFEYRLLQDKDGAALHSFMALPEPEPEPNPNPNPNPNPGPDPEPRPAPDPTYRKEVALVSAAPGQIRQADLAMLGDMHKRLGDEAQPEAGAGSAAFAPHRRVWGRVLRTEPRISQQGDVSPDSRGHMNGFQAGLDLYAQPNFRMGLYVGHLEGDLGVSGFVSGAHNTYAGFNSLRSRYLGVYGTWQSASGLYVDGVVQGADYRSNLRTAGDTAQARTKGDGWLASVEVGKPFALNSHWQIEPQAQLVYRKIKLDDTDLDAVTTVKNHLDDDWLVRVGARIKGNFVTSVGQFQPYGRLNIYKTSSTTDSAYFVAPAGTTEIQAKGGNTTTEFAAGASLQLSKRTSIYGELGKNFANGGDARVKSGVQASLGIKVLW